MSDAYRVAITTDADVVTARQRARSMGGDLGFSSTDLTLLATAISEVARNITAYAGAGHVSLRVVRSANGREGIEVVAQDDGPGIANVELALQDGYTTGNGLGLGLPGARRLVDEFELQTTPGRGTTVRLVKWGVVVARERHDWPAALERGVAGVTARGEARSGDRALFTAWPGGALVAAIDGLGHGGEAADAADEAARVLDRHAREEPAALLQRCHDALVRTRGVVMTLAWFDLEAATLTWTGVGNVEGRLLRAAAAPGVAPESTLIKGGVVGYSLPTVRPTTTALEPGDLLVLATDGVSSTFGGSLAQGTAAQELADRILAEHGRGTDDALVVVVRAQP